MNKQDIRNHLQTTHTEDELQTWFDPLCLRFSDSDNIEVSFPHSLFARWFSKKLQKNFEQEMTRFLGSQTRFIYQKIAGGSRHKSVLSLGSHTFSGLQHIADYRQWSFDTFIYNKKNEFPVSMAKELAISIHNPPYNPFIICGKGNCGKTHLLRAIAVAMSVAISWDSIYLCSVEELAAILTENENPGVFKRKLSRYKAVFIDNAQDLVKYSNLQLELIAIADTFREKKKPFALTLDEGFDQSLLNQKLRSRLQCGLTVTVKRPDLDIRLRYIKAQCALHRFHLKKELMLPLAQRFHNFRAIQGMMTKIAAYQIKSSRPLTHADLEKILAHETLAGTPVTPSSIINHVADAFSLSSADISGNGRTANVTRARQVAMYLCRELLGASFYSLGQYFNGKNHATVLYAYKKIIKNMESDKDTHKLVTRIQKKLLYSSG